MIAFVVLMKALILYSLVTLLLWVSPLSEWINKGFYQVLSHPHNERVSPSIKVLHITDHSLSHWGVWPWDEATFADLNETLLKQNPALITWVAAFSNAKIQAIKHASPQASSPPVLYGTLSPENSGPNSGLMVKPKNSVKDHQTTILSCASDKPSLAEQMKRVFLFQPIDETCAPSQLQTLLLPHEANASHTELNPDSISNIKSGEVVIIHPSFRAANHQLTTRAVAQSDYLSYLVPSFHQLIQPPSANLFFSSAINGGLNSLVFLGCLLSMLSKKRIALWGFGTSVLVGLGAVIFSWKASFALYPDLAFCSLISLLFTRLVSGRIPLRSARHPFLLPQPIWVTAIEIDIACSQQLPKYDKPRLLSSASKVMENILCRYGGKVENWAGDNLVGYWDSHSENNPTLQAVHCANAVLEGLSTLGLSARIGISSGEAYRAPKGADNTTLGLYGYPFEQANRMQTLGKQTRIPINLCANAQHHLQIKGLSIEKPSLAWQSVLPLKNL